MKILQVGGVSSHTLPACPYNSSITDKITHPSVFALNTIQCIIATIFCLLLAIRYNSVLVFNRRIRTRSISNTLWVFLYGIVALRTAMCAVRYSVNDYSFVHSNYYSGFLIAELVLHTLYAFVLSLALNHQRRFRSSAQENDTSVIPNKREESSQLYEKPGKEVEGGMVQNEHSSLIGSNKLETKGFFAERYSYVDLIFVAVLLMVWVSLALDIIYDQNHLYFDLFVTFFIVQRIPVFVLTGIILLSRHAQDGPTWKTKICLFIGCLLGVADDIPTEGWAAMANLDSCALYIMSGADVILIVCILSNVFFFIFARAEFRRNKEECIWSTMSVIQNEFDWRRF